jgi:glutamyl-tRNA reductase
MSFDIDGYATTNASVDGHLSVIESFVPIVRQARQAPDAPVINALRDSLMKIQASELERLYHRLPQLDGRARVAIRQFADCLVTTILHPPTESLRREANDRHRLAEALSKLFKLPEFQSVVGDQSIAPSVAICQTTIPPLSHETPNPAS